MKGEMSARLHVSIKILAIKRGRVLLELPDDGRTRRQWLMADDVLDLTISKRFTQS